MENGETRKRLYIGLLIGSLVLLLALIGIVFLLLTHPDGWLGSMLTMALAAAAGIFLFFLGIGVLAIVVMIWQSRSIPSLQQLSQMVNETLFPLTLLMGRLLGVSKERILRSYISVNNCLVRNKKILVQGPAILILAPHCLQNSDCPYKITVDVENCKGCGKCAVGALKELADKYHATLKVATGGTLARKYITEIHPQGVVAIACERDLSLGIHEISALPVVGVLNIRPNGPCWNTDVNLCQVEQAVMTFCKGG